MRNTFKCAFVLQPQGRRCVLYQCRYIVIWPEGQTERKPPEVRGRILDTGMPDMMRLALILNRPPGSLMCPVYSTDTLFPGP